jgi:hypothetical protein
MNGRFLDYLKYIMDPKTQKYEVLYHDAGRTDFYCLALLPFPFANRDFITCTEYLPEFEKGSAALYFGLDRPDKKPTKQAIRATNRIINKFAENY